MALGTCTICALGIIGLTYSLKFLQNRGMMIISSISFEIYIVHGYFIDMLSNTKNAWGDSRIYLLDNCRKRIVKMFYRFYL